MLPDTLTLQDAVENYITAIEKGLLKIFSKMGISTLRSYRGIPDFRIPRAGLRNSWKPISPRTPSRIGGIGLAEMAQEVLLRHETAYGPTSFDHTLLPSGGEYALRRGGRRHMWTVDAITHLQRASRNNSWEGIREIRQSHQRSGQAELHPAQSVRIQRDGYAGSVGRSGAGRKHRETVCDRGHVLRFHQPRGPRIHGHCHEPAWAAVPTAVKGAKIVNGINSCQTATAAVP